MPPRAIFTTQPVCRLDVAHPVARVSTQRALRVLVYRSASAHRELVTDNGVTVTDNGEDVWIMVPDA